MLSDKYELISILQRSAFALMQQHALAEAHLSEFWTIMSKHSERFLRPNIAHWSESLYASTAVAVILRAPRIHEVPAATLSLISATLFKDNMIARAVIATRWMLGRHPLTAAASAAERERECADAKAMVLATVMHVAFGMTGKWHTHDAVEHLAVELMTEKALRYYVERAQWEMPEVVPIMERGRGERDSALGRSMVAVPPRTPPMRASVQQQRVARMDIDAPPRTPAGAVQRVTGTPTPLRNLQPLTPPRSDALDVVTPPRKDSSTSARGINASVSPFTALIMPKVYMYCVCVRLLRDNSSRFTQLVIIPESCRNYQNIYAQHPLLPNTGCFLIQLHLVTTHYLRVGVVPASSRFITEGAFTTTPPSSTAMRTRAMLGSSGCGMAFSGQNVSADGVLRAVHAGRTFEPNDRVQIYIDTEEGLVFARIIRREDDDDGDGIGDTSVQSWTTFECCLNRMRFVAPCGRSEPVPVTEPIYVAATMAAGTTILLEEVRRVNPIAVVVPK